MDVKLLWERIHELEAELAAIDAAIDGLYISDSPRVQWIKSCHEDAGRIQAAEDTCRVCGEKAYLWTWQKAAKDKRSYCGPECLDIEEELEFQDRARTQLKQAGFLTSD